MIEIHDLFIDGKISVTKTDVNSWNTQKREFNPYTQTSAIEAFQRGFNSSELVASAIYRDGICLAWDKGFFPGEITE